MLGPVLTNGGKGDAEESIYVGALEVGDEPLLRIPFGASLGRLEAFAPTCPAPSSPV